MSTKRIFIFSEDLSRPLDEGIKNVATHVIRALSANATVRGACRLGSDSLEEIAAIPRINRLLLSRRLGRLIRRFDPDVLLYIPRWAGTFADFLRLRMLRFYQGRARSVIIVLQPKGKSKLQTRILGYLRPDSVFTPSPRVIRQMSELGIPVHFLPLPTDLVRFRPAQDAQEKDRLRKKFGIPSEKFIILHVGHINRDRNLEALVPLQGKDRQVLIVSSTSTSSVSYEDDRLKGVLKSAGIIIIDGFLDQIEEIYRLSDLYVFPVIRETGCISLPLSVLEAMASGLPVLTSSFGGLPELFKQPGHGLRYESPDRFLEAVQEIQKNGKEPSGRDEVGLANRFFSQTLQAIIDG